MEHPVERIAAREPRHEFTARDNGHAFALAMNVTRVFVIGVDALPFEIDSGAGWMGRLFAGQIA